MNGTEEDMPVGQQKWHPSRLQNIRVTPGCLDMEKIIYFFSNVSSSTDDRVKSEPSSFLARLKKSQITQFPYF